MYREAWLWKRILPVDDSPDVTLALGQFLEATGKYVIRKENLGQRTLATARDFQPDLIFLDFMMPDLQGDEVAAQLEAEDKLNHIKIVFLTGIVTKGEVESGSVNRISGYAVLAKPVLKKELISYVEDLLGV